MTAPPIPGPTRTVPLHRAIAGLARDPLGALVDFADQAGGDVVRLSLGPFRPYLVSDPAHVQHILRDNAANYVRDGNGMLWRPVKRLFGEGVLADGPVWAASRRTLQPLFTARRVEALTTRMAAEVDEAVERLRAPAEAGEVLDIGSELSRIVCQVIMRVLFADRVSVADALRVVAAQDRIATAIVPRLLVPFVPNSVPVPGDRAFTDGVRTIDEVLLPVVRQARQHPGEGDDVIAALSRAVDDDGRPVPERRVRDDAVAMFATSTETTYGVLTWLWPVLAAHPAVADRLRGEIDEVLGAGPVGPEHLPRLRYTRMVLDELLRIFPVAWLMPRTAVAGDVVGGTRIEPGASVVLSPYVTQRMSTYWDRPDEFDPERFAPDRTRARHRYLHYPFGGGPHVCLGQHLFYLETTLIVAALLSRFEVTVVSSGIPVPRVAASLRPATRVRVSLRPVGR